MGEVIMSGIVPKLKAPPTLSSFAVGSVVKLSEGGVLKDFYVAQHNYESALNGTGRTLLVRKENYGTQWRWNTTSVNAYATSAIDSWLNTSYPDVLGDAERAAAGTTVFYYTPGNGNNVVDTLERSFFLLSLTELGFSASYANEEGTAIPVAGLLTTTTYGQWTRSPYTNNKVNAHKVTAAQSASNDSVTTSLWFRPCFTFPATAQFDVETLAFKGVF